MNGDTNWLIATASLCVLKLGLYIWGIILRKKSFDLNLITPLFLGCAASVAAIKMIVLAFTLPTQVAGTTVASNVDSASIFVGGIVFFLTAPRVLPTGTAGRSWRAFAGPSSTLRRYAVRARGWTRARKGARFKRFGCWGAGERDQLGR